MILPPKVTSDTHGIQIFPNSGTINRDADERSGHVERRPVSAGLDERTNGSVSCLFRRSAAARKTGYGHDASAVLERAAEPCRSAATARCPGKIASLGSTAAARFSEMRKSLRMASRAAVID